ncbi:DNA-methyltransferase [Pseudomonas tolaasii]|uniref:DNA-methyltransferase n=1 Tax=Pseudomonas tolaasii TaxID=29442 RepID=UPI0027375B23|nr:DNA methyltransferase [Pseudomonas tolaasii]WLH51224.1 DNA methyltransferase [Pseudomonas tolaasii]
MTRIAPGCIRDSIFDFLSTTDSAPIKEIHKAVETRLGTVAQSSVRSYLNLNEPEVFERVERGRYRLAGRATPQIELLKEERAFNFDKSKLFSSDCFEWLRDQPSKSVHAIVTDPPYGLVEYTNAEQAKLRAGKGGVWRIPPAFDGHQRAPLPRFTTLTDGDRDVMHIFFLDLARHIARVAVPGANIVVASNPLLAHIVASAMSEGGLELRGYISRLVMTMRGGDRPKNAHEEFSGVSVMPRSMHEPWVVLRTPLEGRVQDNLRKWGTGGFRRISEDRPFGDVIRSHPTPASEKRIAPHPSLKPQGFLRQLVRASLPLGEGIVYDPFAGSGSTLAAANAVGYQSIGTERDEDYFRLATEAIPKLSNLKVKDIDTV